MEKNDKIKENIDQMIEEFKILKLRRDIVRLGKDIDLDSWKRFWYGAVISSIICSLMWVAIYYFLIRKL